MRKRPLPITSSSKYFLILGDEFVFPCFAPDVCTEGRIEVSDIKLFRINGENGVSEVQGSATSVEKKLQTLIERNLSDFLGVHFLATEYSTGHKHGGRIDTLGIDENDNPVIIEYKRGTDENVITQGLYYLDWLMDHKAEFELLAQKRKRDQTIEWDAPRLLCIAGNFTKYDEHAVQQIDRNIELIRYRHYGDEMILLELVNRQEASQEAQNTQRTQKANVSSKTVEEYLQKASKDMQERYESLDVFLMGLGDNVQKTTTKFYVAYRHIKNFACVEVRNQADALLVFLKVNPDEIDLEDGFSRDVRSIGHYGTGDLELTLKSMGDLERAKPLIEKSYEVS